MFRIASMTKAVTGVAAMQCVERGKLSLDQPAGEIMPELAEPKVLEGFDAGGKPILRPARRKITLRMLLTHTAGFVYHIWNAQLNRYYEATGHPTILSGKLAALNAPLAFEPGERWEYGINIDWAGRMVEAVSGQDLEAYMRENIFAPLGMHDTGFMPSAAQFARFAHAQARKPDGSLEPIPADAACEVGVLRRRWRAVLDRSRLHGVPAHAAERRHAGQRTRAEARDRGADGAEPHRRSRRAEAADSASRACRTTPSSSRA